jgi:hypothetical protein
MSDLQTCESDEAERVQHLTIHLEHGQRALEVRPVHIGDGLNYLASTKAASR